MTEERETMTDEEKTLLLEIDALYNGLLRETNGYNYCWKAKDLTDKVIELFNKFSPNYLSQQTIHELRHTYNKEVSYVDSAYEETRKNKAPKKRHTEFLNSMHAANRQIRIDILSVLMEIEKIKEADN